jgi:phage tail-like protein
MALPDDDTAVGHSFGLEIDGVAIAGIREVSGLKIEQDVAVKHVRGKGKASKKKLPGRRKAGEITLTRGLTADDSFEKWIKASRSSKASGARKGGAIIVFDYEGQPIRSYTLINMWPKAWEISASKSGDVSVITEKLVVTYESIEPDGGV